MTSDPIPGLPSSPVRDAINGSWWVCWPSPGGPDRGGNRLRGGIRGSHGHRVPPFGILAGGSRPARDLAAGGRLDVAGGIGWTTFATGSRCW